MRSRSTKEKGQRLSVYDTMPPVAQEKADVPVSATGGYSQSLTTMDNATDWSHYEHLDETSVGYQDRLSAPASDCDAHYEGVAEKPAEKIKY